MITITYSPEGIPNADTKSRELAKEIFAKGKDYTTSTDTLIESFRIMVKKAEIPADSVQFKFHEQSITISSNGKLSSRPAGFADNFDDLLDELLDLK